MAARDDIKAELVGDGYSEVEADALLAAVDAAGYEVVPTGGGSPAAVTEVTPVEIRRIDGMPGRYVCAAQVGDLGWLVWRRDAANAGGQTVDGSASLVPRPADWTGGAFDGVVSEA